MTPRGSLAESDLEPIHLLESPRQLQSAAGPFAAIVLEIGEFQSDVAFTGVDPVSYTHLTLPTIYSE